MARAQVNRERIQNHRSRKDRWVLRCPEPGAPNYIVKTFGPKIDINEDEEEAYPVSVSFYDKSSYYLQKLTAAENVATTTTTRSYRMGG
jgi:hypothetical protein